MQILLHQQERCYEINIVITQENFWYVFQDSSYSQAKCCNAFSSTYFFVFVTSRVQSPLLGSSKRGSFKSSSLSTTSDPSTWKQTDIALGIIQPRLTSQGRTERLGSTTLVRNSSKRENSVHKVGVEEPLSTTMLASRHKVEVGLEANYIFPLKIKYWKYC